MAGDARPVSTASPTATPSRRIRRKAKRWMTCCWSRPQNRSPPSTANSFTSRISRGRERVHVFTDDADLLARRVTDSHERKAAVELQALRDDLAKLGFVPQGTAKGKNSRRRSVADFRMVAVRTRAPDAPDTFHSPDSSRAGATPGPSRRRSAPMVARTIRQPSSKRKQSSRRSRSKPKRSSRLKRLRPPSRKRPVKSCAGSIEQRQQRQPQQRRSGGIHM